MQAGGRALELVWGHSYFELDRFREAIPHLRRGLDESVDAPEAEVRFRHCLGYACGKPATSAKRRAIYEDLLSDDDLDPQVREGVRRNLGELDGADSG